MQSASPIQELISSIDAKKLFASSSVLVFLVSLLGYALAYSFEVGYITYFGVSYQMAEVEFSSFALSSIFVALIMLPLAGLVDIYYEEIGKLDGANPYHRLIKRAVTSTIVAAIFLLPMALHYGSSYLLLLIILFPAIEFLRPIVEGGREWGYRKRILRMEAQYLSNPISLRSYFFSRSFLILASAILMGFSAGTLLASGTQAFLSFKSGGQEYIVVRQYSDELIGVQVKKNALQNNILRISETTGVNFKSEHINKLKVNNRL